MLSIQAKVTNKCLEQFGIDGPVSEIQCTECGQYNPVDKWKQEAFTPLFSHTVSVLVCPDCEHWHNPADGEVPRYIEV